MLVLKRALIPSSLITVALLAGCANKEEPQMSQQDTAAMHAAMQQTTTAADRATAASDRATSAASRAETAAQRAEAAATRSK